MILIWFILGIYLVKQCSWPSVHRLDKLHVFLGIFRFLMASQIYYQGDNASQIQGMLPNVAITLDGTEVKVQKPSSLAAQSQLYSDYKSCTTLKGPVGVDPCGSVTFVSTLYSGAAPDKQITMECGFLKLWNSWLLMVTSKVMLLWWTRALILL